MYSEGVNLLIEGFGDEKFCQLIAKMKRENGILFGVVATGLMQKEGFPYARHGFSFGTDVDQEAAISQRFDGFLKVIKSVDFIWSMAPRTAEYLSDRTAISNWLPVGTFLISPWNSGVRPKT